MLVRGPTLLRTMEPFDGELVAAGLRETGVDIRAGVEVDRVTRNGDMVTVSMGKQTVDGDEVLVATGRTAGTANLGVDTIGLSPGGVPRG